MLKVIVPKQKRINSCAPQSDTQNLAVNPATHQTADMIDLTSEGEGSGGKNTPTFQ